MSKEPEDFLDTDPFDPALLELHEKQREEQEKLQPDQVRAMLDKRRMAYINVFSPGVTEQWALDIVLADLMWFCKVRLPTYDIRDGQHASELSKRKDGRREVFHRIQDFSRLDSDALLMMYTDATTK